MAPARTENRGSVPLPITALVYLFAALSTLLWLLPLFSSRNALFPGGPNFEDILVYKGRFTLYHSAKFFTSRAFSGFAYPAGAAPVYELLYKTHSATQTYLLTAAIVTLAALIALWTILQRVAATKLFLPLLTLSFPLIFLIQRANIELYLFAAIALGLFTYAFNWRYPAAVLFGICAAVKLYPIFLLGLFLGRRKDLHAFWLGLLAAAVTMCAAIAYAGPTFSIAAHGFFTGVDHFQGHYVQTVRSAEVDYDHCFFSPFKVYSMDHSFSLRAWTLRYYLLAGVLGMLLFLRVRTMPMLNRMIFLVTAMVSLPPVSYEYTLTHLYLPALFLLAALISAPRPPALAYVGLTCLLLLFLPLAAIIAIHPIPAGPIQSAILFTLLLLAAATPWPATITSSRLETS